MSSYGGTTKWAHALSLASPAVAGILGRIVFVVTHALAPVAACLAIDIAGILRRGGRVLPPWSLPVVGLFGALPDLCTPHLSLEARYMSWSHTAWFLLGLVPVAVAVAACFGRRATAPLAAVFWLAAALHLATDAICGGIAPLQPWRADVISARWIPFRWWLAGDALFLGLTALGLWLRPRAEARAIDRRRG